MSDSDTKTLSTVYRFLRNEGVGYGKCVKELAELLGKDDNVIIYRLAELQEAESKRKQRAKIRTIQRANSNSPQR